MFNNLQIEIEDLPVASEVDWQPLSRKYLDYYYVVSISAFIFLLIPVLILWLTTERWIATTASVLWIFMLILVMLFARQVYRLKGYALRQHDILYKRGLIFRRVTALPFNRVQHSEIRESAFERAFGLSSLLVYTAGGSSSDLSIPGLLPEQSHRLKDYISRRAEEEEE